jgi:hypothetical protein
MRYTLDEITAERLTSLIGTRAEDKHIEYKQELPGKDDKAKAEFLKDATAFANTDGGDIIYGMAEVKGTASKFFPVENRAIDDAKNQLHQILDTVLVVKGVPRLRARGRPCSTRSADRVSAGLFKHVVRQLKQSRRPGRRDGPI